MRATINDTTLYFDVEGAGLVPDGMTMREKPTIIVLHGGPGFDHAYFKPFLSALADTAQIVYLDQRGQGRSGRPAVETCTIEQMADDAVALCQALGIARPYILGHSFGGFVALTAALRHPDAIGGLILASTAAASEQTADATLLAQWHGAEASAIAARMFGGDFSEATMMEFIGRVFPTYFHDPAASGAMLEAVGRSPFDPMVPSYHYAHNSGRYDVRARLGEIRVPTLVLVGDSDWVCPAYASETIAAGIPGAELVTIPQAGHFTFGEQSDLFASAVRRFMAAPVPAGVGGL
jgi:proline iminopeptidase